MPQTSNNPTYVDILGEQKVQDASIYGINKPKLVGEIEVDGGGNSGGGVEIKYFELKDNSTIGEVTYGGFSFRPRNYTIQAWSSLNEDYASNSYGSYIGGQTRGFSMRKRQSAAGDYNVGQYYSNTDIITIYRENDTISSGKHSGFTDDGIIIDWLITQVDVNFTITAYK